MEISGVEIPEKVLIKLREFMEFHFEARYPDVTKEFYKKCSNTYTAQKLREMKEVIKWIKSKL